MRFDKTYASYYLESFDQQYAMSDSNETIICIIDDAMSPNTSYHALFFTSTRIIIALTVSFGSVWKPVRVYYAEPTEISSQKKAQELAMMTPVSILQADKSNYYIPYTEIKSIILKKRRWLGSSITIMTDDKKYVFVFNNNFDEILRIVSNSLPDKVTIQ